MATVINASVYRINKGGGTPDAPKVEQATPTITVSDGGLIVAESLQQGGVVEGGTKTARKQLDTAEGGYITPTKEEQTPAHAGEFLKSDLVVLPIPSEYIIPKGTNTIVENGEYNVRESEKVIVTVDKGVDAPDVPQAVPSITVSDNGLITATATQEGGLVPSGTKTATKQLTTQEGKIITPTEDEQTAVEDNRYTTGAVKVAPIPSEYIVGDEIAEQEDLITDIEELVAKVGGGSTEPTWKSEYQRVDYIISAEEETYPYIITDFYGDNTCGLEVIASFPKLQDRIPMGSRDNSDATRFYCVYPLSATSIYYGFNTGVTISCQLKVNTIYRLQTNFLNSRLVNVYNYSGTRMGGGTISATLTKQSAPVSIFGYTSASSGDVTSKREYRLYSARCSDGHEVVRDYIPCYRKSDLVVGLYEKVTGQFLTSETGAFTYGTETDW